MRREWELDDLIASWTLVDVDLEMLAGQHSAIRLSFAVMLKVFRDRGPVPTACW